MSKRICNECGCPLTDNDKVCPECGTPIENQTERQEEASSTSSSEQPRQEEAREGTPQATVTVTGKMTHCPDCNAEISIRAYRCPRCGSMLHPDFGNLIYEAFWKKYATFTGRSRRAEFFSFLLLFFFLPLLAWGGERPALIFVIPVIIPMIAVSVRRLHDIGRSGWWLLCPVIPFFFYFKDSDEAENEYGKSPKYQQ